MFKKIYELDQALFRKEVPYRPPRQGEDVKNFRFLYMDTDSLVFTCRRGMTIDLMSTMLEKIDFNSEALGGWKHEYGTLTSFQALAPKMYRLSEATGEQGQLTRYKLKGYSQ